MNSVLSNFFTVVAAIAFYNIVEHQYYRAKWYIQSRKMREHRREWIHFLSKLEGTPAEKAEAVRKKIKEDELS